MNDTQYQAEAESLLRRVERACDRINDRSDADIDNQRNGSVLSLRFRTGGEIVINLQKPLHEVWMAAPSGGYHYRFDGQHWQDTKGGLEFYARLSEAANALAGQDLGFNSVDA